MLALPAAVVYSRREGNMLHVSSGVTKLELQCPAGNAVGLLRI